MEKEIGQLLKKRKLTLAVAESCTGGLVGHRITSVSGSSAYFLGGVVAYSDDAKRDLLGVEDATLRTHGAVSEATAAEMAEGVRRRCGSDIGLAVTGIAGPTGGSPDKPVGLVFIAVADERRTRKRRLQFPGGREEIKNAASLAALEMLKAFIMEGAQAHGEERR